LRSTWFLIRKRLNDPEFSTDLRASLKIEHGDKPLGEEALREMLENRRDDNP
jgi:hypothetical protein